MSFNPNRRTLLSAAVASLIAGNASAADYQLEEVLVMAEKRSESLQDISQAVTALTGDDLD
ncbi:MAG: hypothetical protein VXZ35_06125, partial [Pseudomonadota bacterium]|nr:hypothetical protein [Pseudomonadota bacterium]